MASWCPPVIRISAEVRGQHPLVKEPSILRRIPLAEGNPHIIHAILFLSQDNLQKVVQFLLWSTQGEIPRDNSHPEPCSPQRDSQCEAPLLYVWLLWDNLSQSLVSLGTHTGEKPLLWDEPGCSWKFPRLDMLVRPRRKQTGVLHYIYCSNVFFFPDWITSSSIQNTVCLLLLSSSPWLSPKKPFHDKILFLLIHRFEHPYHILLLPLNAKLTKVMNMKQLPYKLRVNYFRYRWIILT